MYIAGRKRLANFHAADKKTKRNDIDDESYPLFVQSLFGWERGTNFWGIRESLATRKSPSAKCRPISSGTQKERSEGEIPGQ